MSFSIFFHYYTRGWRKVILVSDQDSYDPVSATDTAAVSEAQSHRQADNRYQTLSELQRIK